MWAVLFSTVAWGTVGWLLVAMWDTRLRLRQVEQRSQAIQKDFLAEVQLRYGETSGEE